jgi:hypothetical protein
MRKGVYRLEKLLVMLGPEFIDEQSQDNGSGKLEDHTAKVDVNRFPKSPPECSVPKYIGKIFKTYPGAIPNTKVCLEGLKGQGKPAHGQIGKNQIPYKTGEQEGIDNPELPDFGT